MKNTKTTRTILQRMTAVLAAVLFFTLTFGGNKAAAVEEIDPITAVAQQYQLLDMVADEAQADADSAAEAYAKDLISANELIEAQRLAIQTSNEAKSMLTLLMALQQEAAEDDDTTDDAEIEPAAEEAIAAEPILLVPMTFEESVRAAITPAEIDLLGALVFYEANAEPYAGKVAVVNAVLNRIYSTKFPNTVSEVIYEKGQFAPARLCAARAASGDIPEECRKAVQEALQGVNVIDNCTSFGTVGAVYSVYTIGRHSFYGRR